MADFFAYNKRFCFYRLCYNTLKESWKVFQDAHNDLDYFSSYTVGPYSSDVITKRSLKT